MTYLSGGRLYVVCQIVSVDAASDEIFSVVEPLTAELAMLLQESGREANFGYGRGILSLPLPGDVLAMTAADIDEVKGDELVILTPSELLVFTFQEGSLDLLQRIPLADMRAALLQTREPTGTVLVSDLDGDSHKEILIGSNLWAGGAVIYVRDSVRIRHLDFQPLALTIENSRLAIVGGHYRPGEDTFLDDMSFASGDFTFFRNFVMPGIRSLHRLDHSGTSFIRITPLCEAWLQDSLVNGRGSSLDLRGVKAMTTSPRVAAGWSVHAASSRSTDYGDRIILTKIISPNHPAVGILTEYDILALAVVDPAGPMTRVIALCGRSEDGQMWLALYSWPAGS